MNGRLSWRLPLAVFAVVLGVRLVTLVSLERDVLARWPAWTETDEHGTLVWAERLAAGNWLDSPPFRHFAQWQRRFGTPEQWDSWYPRNAYYQGVLYPYLIAAARVAFGEPIFPVRLAQNLLAAAAAAALAAATRNVAGRNMAGPRGSARASAAAGAVAGLAAGLYAPALFHDGFVQRDGPLLSVSVFLVAAPFLRSLGSPGGAFVTGLAAGAGILLKQTMVPLAVVSLWATVRQESRPPGLRRVAAASLGLALPLLLLVGRNMAAGASPFSYDTREGVGIASYLSRGSTATVVPSPLTGEILSKAGGSTWKAAQLAFESHDRPADFALLVGKKIATFFHAFEVPDDANFYLFQRRLFPLRFLPVYACLLGPGLVGLFLAMRRLLTRAETLAVLTALLVPFVSSVLPAITSRYRLGIAAPLAFGAGLLAWYLLSDGVPARRKVGACAAALVVSAVTLLPPIIPTSRFRASDEKVLEMLKTGRM